MRHKKKSGLWLALLCVVLLLTGCAPKTIEDAVAQADKKLEKMDFVTCKASAFLSDDNTNYIVQIQMDIEADWWAYNMDETTRLSMLIADAKVINDNIEEYYDELEPIFEKFPDVKISFVFIDPLGVPQWTYIDHEFFEWES